MMKYIKELLLMGLLMPGVLKAVSYVYIKNESNLPIMLQRKYPHTKGRFVSPYFENMTVVYPGDEQKLFGLVRKALTREPHWGASVSIMYNKQMIASLSQLVVNEGLGRLRLYHIIEQTQSKSGPISKDFTINIPVTIDDKVDSSLISLKRNRTNPRLTTIQTESVRIRITAERKKNKFSDDDIVYTISNVE